MLRVLIVLPIYLAAAFFVPEMQAYDRFAALVESTETRWIVHVMDYAVAGIAAALVAWRIERLCYGEQFGAFFRVLRIGLIGVVVAAGYQLFCLFTGQPMSIVMILVPFVFMVAEVVYELAEAALDRTWRAHRR